MFVGNGLENWILKDLFLDVIDGKIQDAEFINPYTFPNKKIEKDYLNFYFGQERPELSLYENAKWRKYSSLLNLEIEEGDLLHIFFVWGRDIERLFDPILLKWLKQRWGNQVITYMILLDSLEVTTDYMGWGKAKECFEHFDYVASFDKHDSEQHNLLFFPTPYTVRAVEPCDNFCSDIFFIGAAKGRDEVISTIADSAADNGLAVDFRVYDFLGDNSKIRTLKRCIGYDEVIKEVAKTKCILEILADGQKGSSLRYYEAVIYNKKLLTNNPEVLNYDFYDPRYIQYFENVEDIDYSWIAEDINVDYQYDNRYSVENFIQRVKQPTARLNYNGLVSVIIPTYNRADTLLRSVNSVLRQTYSNLELIVVDDGSTDESVELLKSVNDPRLTVICQENAGACAARNNGINNSHGEYIAFQDSDDEWNVDKIENQLEILRNKGDIDVVFCNANKVDVNESTASLLHMDIAGGMVTKDQLQAYSLVSTQTIFARKECFDAEMFDENMPRLQDYDLVIRLAEIFAFWYVSKPLVTMFVQGDSISVNPRKAITARYMLLKKYPEQMKNNTKMYLSTLQSILSNSMKEETTDIDAEREYFYLQKYLKLKRENDKLKKISALSDEVLQNNQLRFLIGKEDSLNYTTLRRTGGKGSREIQFVTTIDGENKIWNKLINKDGRKNWITPEEFNKKFNDLEMQIRKSVDVEKKRADDLEYSIKEIRNSFSYKLGLFLTWVPRKVRELFRKK